MLGFAWETFQANSKNGELQNARMPKMQQGNK